MQQITKEEKNLLIEHNILELIDGKYPDLAITNRNKKSKRKKYYVPDYMVKKVRLIKAEMIETISENK